MSHEHREALECSYHETARVMSPRDLRNHLEGIRCGSRELVGAAITGIGPIEESVKPQMQLADALFGAHVFETEPVCEA